MRQRWLNWKPSSGGWNQVTSTWKPPIDMYARGAHLKAHCESRLKAAEARVEKLVIGQGGQPTGSEPFGEDN